MAARVSFPDATATWQQSWVLLTTADGTPSMAALAPEFAEAVAAIGSAATPLPATVVGTKGGHLTVHEVVPGAALHGNDSDARSLLEAVAATCDTTAAAALGGDAEAEAATPRLDARTAASDVMRNPQTLRRLQSATLDATNAKQLGNQFVQDGRPLLAMTTYRGGLQGLQPWCTLVAALRRAVGGSLAALITEHADEAAFASHVDAMETLVQVLLVNAAIAVAAHVTAKTQRSETCEASVHSTGKLLDRAVRMCDRVLALYNARHPKALFTKARAASMQRDWDAAIAALEIIAADAGAGHAAAVAAAPAALHLLEECRVEREKQRKRAAAALEGMF